MEDLYNRTNSIRRQPIIYTQTETSNKNINLNNNYNQLNYINWTNYNNEQNINDKMIIFKDLDLIIFSSYGYTFRQRMI